MEEGRMKIGEMKLWFMALAMCLLVLPGVFAQEAEEAADEAAVNAAPAAESTAAKPAPKAAKPAAPLPADSPEGVFVSGWSRFALSPYSKATKLDDKGKVIDEFESAGFGDTGGHTTDMQVSIKGISRWAGFNLSFKNQIDDGSQKDYFINESYSNIFNIGASAWIKPFGNDWLKIEGGKFGDGTLAGKIGSLNGGFENFVYKQGGDGSTIFKSFSTNNGFVISSKPLGAFVPSMADSLYLGIKLGSKTSHFWAQGLGGLKAADRSIIWADELEWFYKGIQVAVGWNFAGIGLARVQYVGDWTDLDTEGGQGGFYSDVTNNGPSIFAAGWTIPAPRFEAAFAFTMIEGLLVDVGAKFYLPLDVEDAGYNVTWKMTESPVIALGARWNWNAISVAGRVDISTGDQFVTETVTITGPATVNMHLVPAYDFGFLKVGLDAGFSTETAPTSKGDNSSWVPDVVTDIKPLVGFGFGAFVERKVTHGTLKAGVTWNMGTKRGDIPQSYQSFTIPVVVEVSF
jgi:hypothetical protein